MNLNSLLEDDGEDDVDFVPTSSGSSEDEESADAPQPSSVDVSALKQTLEEMKESWRSKSFVKEPYPTCQRVEELYPPFGPCEGKSCWFKNVSVQPAVDERDWRRRNVNLAPGTISAVIAQMDQELNHVRVRKMRFAGKVYEVQVDPRKLAGVTEDTDAKIAELQRVLVNARDVSAMTKSKADWRSYVNQNAEGFTLNQHRKSAGAVLKKQQFLSNVASAATAAAGKRRRRRNIT